ncbi:MAG: winged helix-turn-helix domain-containing tetratricopeptide repeat protein [Candidatus Acidiferrales bacterium]
MKVKLSDQPFCLLAMLLERPGKLVTREELQQRLWPNQPYGEFSDGLNTAVNRLRTALDDNAETPRFVETIPKRGYRFIATVEAESPRVDSRAGPIARRRWWLFWLAGSAAILAVAVAWQYPRQRPPASTPGPKAVAVLPFSNEGAGPKFDYLRYAIANDLITDLSHVRSVTVRPFASTARYASQPADPATVGKRLRVSDIIAGGYLLENDNLHVTMELVDVARDATVWRTELVVSPQRLIVLGNRLAGRMTQGLLPTMNIREASVSEMPVPTSERAFDLYLHSIAASHDPEPNLAAIADLEKSVSLDPNYAPAWGELGRRYYIDYEYGKGGAASRAKALEAYKNETRLDPNSGVNVAIILAQQGELSAAYDRAAILLRRRPNDAMAHMTMGYVLRYAGLLDEATKQCKAAIAIDPGNSYFRSCATPFTLLGQYDEARKFALLDENTGFGAALRMEIALRTGDRVKALAEAAKVSKAGGMQYADIVQACLGPDTQQELPQTIGAMRRIESGPNWTHDPEGFYRYASVLSFCGQADAALDQLRNAIQGNYCSYPAMENDPLFAPIRQQPAFKELEQAAIRCQQNFLTHQHQVDATLQANRF